MQPKVNNDSTDLKTIISRFDVENAKLLVKSDWCGRKAFFACDGENQWHIVVLNIIQRIQRWFGSKKFANTQSKQITKYLKDCDIEALDKKIKADKKFNVTAFLIEHFHKQWLNIKQLIDDIDTIKVVPLDLRRIITDNASLKDKETRKSIKDRGVQLWGFGDIHIAIAKFFVKRMMEKDLINKEELEKWGRLTEALKRYGHDINGALVEHDYKNAFYIVAAYLAKEKINNSPLVDFYLKHGGNPYHEIGRLALKPLFFLFEDEESMNKFMKKNQEILEDQIGPIGGEKLYYTHYMRKDLKTVTAILDEGLGFGKRVNVLEWAKELKKDNMIKFYSKHLETLKTDSNS